MLCAAGRWLRVDTGGNDISPLYLLPLAGFIVSLAMSAPRVSDRLLRHQDVSYGLYLYHMVAIDFLVRIAAPSEWVSFAASLILSLVLAALSWTLIERHYLRHKHGALRTESLGATESRECR